MWRLACTLVVLPFARSQDMESEVDLGFETNMRSVRLFSCGPQEWTRGLVRTVGTCQ